MSLTPEQQAIRQQLNNFRSVLPDRNTDLNSVLLLSILDELRMIRSTFDEFLNQSQGDNPKGLRDRMTVAKADCDDNEF